MDGSNLCYSNNYYYHYYIDSVTPIEPNTTLSDNMQPPWNQLQAHATQRNPYAAKCNP